MVDILLDNADKNGSWLTGPKADIGRPAIVKTGTVNDVRDIYAAGGIPQLITAVWTGNADNSLMGSTRNSINSTLVIWHNIMAGEDETGYRRER